MYAGNTYTVLLYDFGPPRMNNLTTACGHVKPFWNFTSLDIMSGATLEPRNVGKILSESAIRTGTVYVSRGQPWGINRRQFNASQYDYTAVC